MNGLELADLIVGIFSLAMALVWAAKDSPAGAVICTLCGVFCICVAVI